MANGTFNVSEFNTIYSVLDDGSSKIDAKSREISGTCDQLSQLLKSTDSDLSNAYLRVSDTIMTAKGKIISLLSQLEEEMKMYASRTMANEQQASESLNKLNSEIESVAAAFKEIAGRSS